MTNRVLRIVKVVVKVGAMVGTLVEMGGSQRVKDVMNTGGVVASGTRKVVW